MESEGLGMGLRCMGVNGGGEELNGGGEGELKGTTLSSKRKTIPGPPEETDDVLTAKAKIAKTGVAEDVKETELPPKKTKGLLGEFEGSDGKMVPGNVFWKAFRFRGRDMQEVVKIELKLRSEPDSTAAAVPPQEHIPTDPVRLDGKNYPIWARRMEYILKELEVAYVLNDPCPMSTVRGPEASSEEMKESMAAEKKWKKDNSLCLRAILNYLSDDLLHRYSKRKKTTTAKQLWEDLKFTFGTKRSLVRRYMEFQMVEEKPIVEQVEELNLIFETLSASGMGVDEKFHVSAIIAKLPASWTDVSIKLMSESLPLEGVMDRLRAEGESRMKEKP